MFHGDINYPPYPAFLGYDRVGRVVELGENVKDYRIGDIIHLPLPHRSSHIYHKKILDENGNKLNNGPVIVFGKKRIQNGFVRVDRTIDFYKRLKIYEKDARNPRIKNLHFEYALNKYGFNAFKVKILAICKSREEFIFTEYFWTLYFNRIGNSEGYDLKINDNF